jgi:DNA-binding NtrC family response regulator
MMTQAEILIISGDDEARLELAAICREAGYTAATLGNVRAGAATLAETQCQLVMLDFASGGREANRLAYHIHGLPVGRGRVPVVAIANDLLPETVERLEAMRVNGVIAKPLVPDEVRNQIAASIDLLATA